jgi:hypothetical protein
VLGFESVVVVGVLPLPREREGVRERMKENSDSPYQMVQYIGIISVFNYKRALL